MQNLTMNTPTFYSIKFRFNIAYKKKNQSMLIIHPNLKLCRRFFMLVSSIFVLIWFLYNCYFFLNNFNNVQLMEIAFTFNGQEVKRLSPVFFENRFIISLSKFYLMNNLRSNSIKACFWVF